MNDHDLAESLKILRQRAGISQYRLAEIMGESRSRIAAYEAGQNAVPLDFATRWAEALGFRLSLVVTAPDQLPEAALNDQDRTLVELSRGLSPADRDLLIELARGLRPGRPDGLRDAAAAVVHVLAGSASPGGARER